MHSHKSGCFKTIRYALVAGIALMPLTAYDAGAGVISFASSQTTNISFSGAGVKTISGLTLASSNLVGFSDVSGSQTAHPFGTLDPVQAFASDGAAPPPQNYFAPSGLIGGYARGDSLLTAPTLTSNSIAGLGIFQVGEARVDNPIVGHSQTAGTLVSTGINFDVNVVANEPINFSYDLLLTAMLDISAPLSATAMVSFHVGGLSIAVLDEQGRLAFLWTPGGTINDQPTDVFTNGDFYVIDKEAPFTVGIVDDLDHEASRSTTLAADDFSIQFAAIENGTYHFRFEQQLGNFANQEALRDLPEPSTLAVLLSTLGCFMCLRRAFPQSKGT